MNKIRNEKGMTLVALIVTVVILLILAAVAIAAIQNENIIAYANNSALGYTLSQEKEIIKLSELEAKMQMTNTLVYFDKIGNILSSKKNVNVTKDKGALIIEFKNSENKYIMFEIEKIGTITYIEGMIWKEWCNSEYNKVGLSVRSGNNWVELDGTAKLGNEKLYSNGRQAIGSEKIDYSVTYSWAEQGWY